MSRGTSNQNSPHDARIAQRLADLWARDGFWHARWSRAGLVRAPESLDGLAPLSVEDLAKMIRADTRFKKGMRVVLLACRAGEGGPGSTAAMLARALQTPVQAADFDVYVGHLLPEDGKYRVPSSLASTVPARDDRDLAESPAVGTVQTFGTSGW